MWSISKKKIIKKGKSVYKQRAEFLSRPNLKSIGVKLCISLQGIRLSIGDR